MADDPREQLASLAASLRAYLEWQEDTGATGFPKRANRTPVEARPPAPAGPATSAPQPARPPETPPPPPPAAAAPVVQTAPILAEAPVVAVSESDAADRHTRLPQLAREVASCRKCVLAETRTQTVFARGNPDAQLCFVGEAPGADEDAQGLPFVGRAGQLLDRMITAMGLSPEADAYVCNIIKCRPPGNRRPEPEEVDTCIPYLHEQLALVKPRVVVALGNTAVAALLGTKVGITKVRGQWRLYKGQTLVMPTYHPSYLLRPGPTQTESKRQAWEDLQLVMRELGLSRAKS